MTALLRSELTKLRTVRTHGALLVGAAAAAALLAVAITSVAGQEGNPELGTSLFTRNLFAGAALPLALALVAGVIHTAGEHQHGVAVPTFLVTPRRWRVVAAKVVTAAGLGVLFAGVAITVTVGVSSLLHGAEGADLFATFDREVGRQAGTLILTGAFYGAVGASVGALVRNQLGAILLVLIWSQIVETSVLPTFLPDLSRWLPAELLASIGGAAGRDLLAPVVAGALLVGYAALLAVLAARTTDRADLA